MNTKYVETLRKIAMIEKKNHSTCRKEFKRLFLDNFLFDMEIIDETFNRIKPSTGNGQISTIWWCGIFNIEFYNKVLGIYNLGSMSASRGHYVDYLFNEEKTHVYLILHQASSKISSRKGYNIQKIGEKEIKRTIEEIQLENNILRNIIPPRINYLTNIDNKLTQKSSLGKDYELAVIYAIEYNLQDNIPNERFANDLLNMLHDFEVIKKFYIKNNYNFLINTNDISEDYYIEDAQIEETCENPHTTSKLSNILDDRYLDNYDTENDNYCQEINHPFHLLTLEQIQKKDNRPPEYTTNNQTRKRVAKRDADIAKNVLLHSQYQCSIDTHHITFMTKFQHYYAEAHHIVPMSYQSYFEDFNLDRSNNILCLCANCHKAVHHGDDNTKRLLLQNIYEKCTIKEDPHVKNIAPDFESFIKIFFQIK